MIPSLSAHLPYLWLVVASFIAGVMNAVVSMVFAGAGGYGGAQYARSMNASVLRTIVVVTGCAVAANFFWRQP
jgi:hypothetical protein